jgi:formylglycine-generating enzyme required for sulfatase activity
MLVLVLAVTNCNPKANTNSIEMKFIHIPAGTFTMGSPLDEQERIESEIQHTVTFSKPFLIQTTEVTQAQWRQVMEANPSYNSSCGDDCPVEKVSWNDAQDFIHRLNQKEGTNAYRLPTEAEWEYAARAESTSAFCNGSITKIDCELDPNLDQVGWYCGNMNNRTQPVGKKKPNAWGLYDMHGNVWEWVQDWYGPYETGKVTDPIGPVSGQGKVYRGGGPGMFTRFCRSANRLSAAQDYRFMHLGFRLAKNE